MKKKLLAILMGVVVTAVGGATLAACSDNGGGDTGTTVTNGEDGKSAYQIWLDAGNTGTEADFIKYLTGSDGVGVKDIAFEIVDAYTIYTVTLTDGSVLTKYYNTYSSSEVLESDIRSINPYDTSCNVIDEGDPEPNIIYSVSYNHKDYYESEYVYLSDMDIIAGEVDYTKAGRYPLLLQYKDYMFSSAVNVSEVVNDSIHSISVSSTPMLWFSDDTTAENLKHVYISLRVSGESVLYSPTENQYVSGLPTSATYEGISDLEFKIDGKTIKVPVYIVDTTCAKFIAESEDYQVYLTSNPSRSNYSIMKGEDLFVDSEVMTIQTSLQHTATALMLPLTEDMLVTTAETPVAFSSETAGIYTYTLDLKKAGLNEKATIRNTISVDVYDYDSRYSLDVTLSDKTTSYSTTTGNAIPVSETLPEIYVNLSFYGGSAYIYDVLLTEEMIEKIAEIDFSTPGYISLNINYEGVKGSLTLSTIDLTKNNIDSASYHNGGSSSYEYTVGKKTVEDIQAQIIAEHTRGALLSVEYYTRVAGQLSTNVIVTSEMIDFSCTDFTKLGSQTVYAVYGEGANQVRTPIATVDIIPDADMEDVESTTYAINDENSLVLYKNNIAIIVDTYVNAIDWGTYTEENGKVVITNYTGNMYFTLDTSDADALSAEPTEVEGDPTKTYEMSMAMFGSPGKLVVKAYADYLVFGMEGEITDEQSGTTTTVFMPSLTLSASARTAANTIYVLGIEYQLNEDGSIVPMIYAI